MLNFDLSLYLVTDRSLALGRDLRDVVEEAIKGGVTLIQLREKDVSSREFYELAVNLKKYISPYEIPLIINDRLDIALACNADGLHIGQQDIPYECARKILGDNKIIGLSVENIEDVLVANSLDVDYVGISPVFSTSTKKDTAPALGIGGVRELTRLSIHPTVAIGGINSANAQDVLQTGVDGISVVSAIMSASSPQVAARELSHIINDNQMKYKNYEVE